LEGEGIELMMIDLSVAFKTLPVREEERPLQIARADCNTFVGLTRSYLGGEAALDLGPCRGPSGSLGFGAVRPRGSAS
jgi:hypothetical protein